MVLVVLFKLACFVIFLVAACQIFNINARIASMDDRLRRMESILSSPRPAPTRPGEDSRNQYEAVESLIRQGQVIDAIKLYQQETGATFRDAKDAVDAMQRRIA